MKTVYFDIYLFALATDFCAQKYKKKKNSLQVFLIFCPPNYYGGRPFNAVQFYSTSNHIITFVKVDLLKNCVPNEVAQP